MVANPSTSVHTISSMHSFLASDLTVDEVNEIQQNCELEDRNTDPSDSKSYSDTDKEAEADRNYIGDDEAVNCPANEKRYPTKIHHF
jgi:hypothetical protein